MNLKKRKEWYMGRFGGEEGKGKTCNYIIISQIKRNN